MVQEGQAATFTNNNNLQAVQLIVLDVCMTHNASAACSMWRHPCKDKAGAHIQCLRQREEGSSKLRRAEEEHAAAVICLSSHVGICRENRQDGGLASKPLFLQPLGFACICLEYDWTWAVRCRPLHMGSSKGCCKVVVTSLPVCCHTCTVAIGPCVNVKCESTSSLAWCCSQTQRSQQLPMISLVSLM